MKKAKRETWDKNKSPVGWYVASVLILADGSEFLLVAIEEFDQEIARTRNNPKLMALLETRARQTETAPLDVVKQRLGL
jgi:hypothetical protein